MLFDDLDKGRVWDRFRAILFFKGEVWGGGVAVGSVVSNVFLEMGGSSTLSLTFLL